jgi:hypothetical protein
VFEKAHLIMTSMRPTRRREILVYGDSLGHTVGLSEFGFASSGLLSATGDQVIANIDATGRVRGFHDRDVIQMSDSGIVGFDTAALRRMREHAVHRSSREALDGTAQLKVRKLMDWMRSRCK